jgi:hypothetical protein
MHRLDLYQSVREIDMPAKQAQAFLVAQQDCAYLLYCRKTTYDSQTQYDVLFGVCIDVCVSSSSQFVGLICLRPVKAFPL